MGVGVVVGLLVGAGALVAVRPFVQVVGLQATDVGSVVLALPVRLVGRLVLRRFGTKGRIAALVGRRVELPEVGFALVVRRVVVLVLIL